MSALLVNRVHSAHPRLNRPPPPNTQSSHVHQRPTSSVNVRGSHTDVLELPAWRTLSSSTSIGKRSHFQRPKTGSVISSYTNAPFAVSELQPIEIESLLRSFDRDDTFIAQVDCLADYRKLVETIDIYKTPIDHKSLYALQKRENLIVQHNACRDKRFRSLLKALEPMHVTKTKDNHINPIKRKSVLDYQAYAGSMNY